MTAAQFKARREDLASGMLAALNAHDIDRFAEIVDEAVAFEANEVSA